MPKTTLIIPAMDCPEEVKLIKGHLQSMEGIQQLAFNLIERELTVTHQFNDPTRILKALSAIAMPGSIKGLTSQRIKFHSAVAWKDWIVIALSGLFALSAEIIAFVTHSETSFYVIGLAIASILLGGRQTLTKAIRSLRYFMLNMNFLMTIAILGAIAIGEWPEAAMVNFLFALAELIEVYSLDKARHAIRGLMEVTPDSAMVHAADGSFQQKPVTDILQNAIIRVKPGERVPLDGIIVKGESTVNQAPITGESVSVSKKVGDAVFAGTINDRGAFEFRVTVNPNDTLLSKIVRAVQQAQAMRAPTQRFVDEFAKYYTPCMVILALLFAILPPLFLGAAFLPWFYKALVLLVIACPCALVISTPVTLVSGLTAAARHGLLIKGGAYLEAGHKLKAIALDKTGTLTYGKPVVTDIISLNDTNNSKTQTSQILLLAASLEAYSEHPIAEAIVSRCRSEQPNNRLLHVENFEAIPGSGVTGIIDGKRYFLGNHRFAEEKAICSATVEALLKELEHQSKTTIVIGTEQKPIAILAVADTIRETSAGTIDALKRLGLNIAMITGDNAVTAQAIGEQLGIKDIRADLLPEDKLKVIDSLQKQYGPVGMVGDGINDAPALARSSIGFAMGITGTDVALETADVALMEDNINKLPYFIALSRRTWYKLAENICLSIGIKVIFFILALFGFASLWMAVFADMGASLIVVFNGLRLLKFSEKE